MYKTVYIVGGRITEDFRVVADLKKRSIFFVHVRFETFAHPE